jgi:hypothetical protein
MTTHYAVRYEVSFKRHVEELTYSTDDPVAFEEFLSELLEKGFRIQEIKHDGKSISARGFDHLIKTAANILASRHIRASLAIDSAEAHHRFGFAA